VRQFSPAGWITRLIQEYACDQSMWELRICENFLFLLVGFDAKQTNMVSVFKLSLIRSMYRVHI